MMSTNEQSTLVAVFVNRDQANQAIDNLRHAGFSYDQMRLVQNGTNSFMEDLKSLFRGQSTASTNSADDWMRIGVPEQDAQHYQSELDAGRSIVLLKAVSNPEVSLNILHQSGAYEIAFRFRTTPPTMPSGMQNTNVQSARSPSQAQPGTYNSNVPPAAPPSQPQAGTYNPNAQQGMYNATPPRQSVPGDERNG